jgi:hypothetical protein
MKNATEMRKITNEVNNKASLKIAEKRQAWIFKAIRKATKRARKGYSWIEVKIPSAFNKNFIAMELEDRGYNVTVGAKHYRISW